MLKYPLLNLARANSLARIYLTYKIARAHTAFIHPIMKSDGEPSMYIHTELFRWMLPATLTTFKFGTFSYADIKGQGTISQQLPSRI